MTTPGGRKGYSTAKKKMARKTSRNKNNNNKKLAHKSDLLLRGGQTLIIAHYIPTYIGCSHNFSAQEANRESFRYS